MAHRTIAAILILMSALAGCTALAAQDQKRIAVHVSTPSGDIAELLKPMQAGILTELQRTYAAGGYRIEYVDDLAQRDRSIPLLLVMFVHEDSYGEYCRDDKPTRGGCAHQRQGTAFVKVRQSDFSGNPVQQDRTMRRLVIVTVHETGHLLGIRHPERETAGAYPDVMGAVAAAKLWKSPPASIPADAPHYISQYGFSMPQEHFEAADAQFWRGIGVRRGTVRAAEYAVTME